jgi:hypothetical protein
MFPHADVWISFELVEQMKNFVMGSIFYVGLFYQTLKYCLNFFQKVLPENFLADLL